MSTRRGKTLCKLVSLLAAASAATFADTIDFESLCPSGQTTAGPCSGMFSTVGNAQQLDVSTSLGTVVFEGGALFDDIAYLPSDETALYGTAGNAGSIGVHPGTGFTNPLTIIFPVAIDNLSLDILNGNTMTVDYRLADNDGNVADFQIAPNLSGGVQAVDFAATGNVVTITAETGQSTSSGMTWDFLIDNVGFTAAEAPANTAPEPRSAFLIGIGLVAIGLSRRSKKYLLALAPAAVLLTPPGASAATSTALTAPALTLSDNYGDSVTIDAGTAVCAGACSTSGSSTSTPGNISWSGTLGVFTISVAGGQTKPALQPPQIAMTLRVTTGAFGAGANSSTLTAQWSDNGFNGTGPVTMVASDSLSGSVTVAYSGYVDSSNSLFGTGILVGNAGPGGNVTGTGPVSEPFSMTVVAKVTMGANASYTLTSLNLMATQVLPLTLACPSASGQTNMAYDSHVVAGGGLPPYTYATSGTLPVGLSLNPSTGELSGTPVASGIFPFTALITDSSGNSGSNSQQAACSITITNPPAPLSLACPAAGVQQDTNYSSSLAATGGTPPYSFSLSSGSLPPGLSLNPSTGAITGSPTTAGPFSFTGKAVDSSGTAGTNTATAACKITVAPPLALSCPAGTGQVGVAYASALSASGGAGANTYSLTSGFLPPGLALNKVSGAITGTPTASGSFSFTGMVQDSAGNSQTNATASCSVTIAPSTVLLNSPTNPSTGSAGATATVTGSGFPNGTINAANVVVTFSTACGGTPVATTSATTVVLGQGTTGQIGFSIPSSLSSATYYISINDSASGDADFRSANCALLIVAQAAPAPNVTIKMDLAQVQVSGTDIYFYPVGDGPFKTMLTNSGRTSVKYNAATTRFGRVWINDTLVNGGLLKFGSVGAADGSFVFVWGPTATVQSLTIELQLAADRFFPACNGVPAATCLDGGNAFGRVTVAGGTSVTFDNGSIPPTQATGRVIWMQMPAGPFGGAGTACAAAPVPAGLKYCGEAKATTLTSLNGVPAPTRPLFGISLLERSGRLAWIYLTPPPNPTLGLAWPAEAAGAAGANADFQGAPAVINLNTPWPGQQPAIYCITKAGRLTQIWGNGAGGWNIDYPAEYANLQTKVTNFQGSVALYPVALTPLATAGKKAIYAITTTGHLVQLWDTNQWNLDMPAEYGYLTTKVSNFQGSPAVFAVSQTPADTAGKKCIYAITADGHLVQMWDTNQWNLDWPAEYGYLATKVSNFRGSPAVFPTDPANRKKRIYAIDANGKLWQMWDDTAWHVANPRNAANSPNIGAQTFLPSEPAPSAIPAPLATGAQFTRALVAFPSNPPQGQGSVFGIITGNVFAQMWNIGAGDGSWVAGLPTPPRN